MYFKKSIRAILLPKTVIERPVTDITKSETVHALFESQSIILNLYGLARGRSWIVCIDYDLRFTYIACSVRSLRGCKRSQN